VKKFLFPVFVLMAFFCLVGISAELLIEMKPAVSVTSNAPYTPDWFAMCGGTYNLCGYVERVSRKERIPRIFERALNFSEGLAGVRVDGLYGYIDASGKIVIPPKFDLVGEFRNGHAEVLLANKAGIIDRSGKIILQPEYARAIPFGNAAALVAPGKRASPYWDDDERLDTQTFEMGKKGLSLIDIASGKILKTGLFIKEFDKDTYVWAVERGSGGYGLLAPDGTWKIEPSYMEVSGLFQGRSIVCTFIPADRRRDPKAAHCGAIDKNGDIALPMQPTKIYGYWNGLYRIFKDRKTGLLNEAGVLLGGQVFDDINLGEVGDVVEVQKNGEWVGLNRQGNIVADPNDGKVLLTCASGLRFVSKAGGIEVLTADGKATTPYRFDNLLMSNTCQFPFDMSYRKKYGFLNAEGKLLIDPPDFDNVYLFNAGYAAVHKDGKWGIIDDRGNFTVPLQFKDLRPDTGLFAVTTEGKSVWIDAHGKPMPEPNRDAKRRETLECRDGGGKIISKTYDGKTVWGLADANGRTIVEPKYRAISCYENGLAWVPFDEKKAWCAIDRSQHVRQNVRCVENWMASHIFDAGPEKMSDDNYESGVLWMRANLDYGIGLREEPPRIVGNLSTSF
jgi:hypothetical protein